jgi:hypothetical protein
MSLELGLLIQGAFSLYLTFWVARVDRRLTRLERGGLRVEMGVKLLPVDEKHVRPSSEPEKTEH